MRTNLKGRPSGRVIVLVAAAILAVAAYVGAQGFSGIARGQLVPFADPTDNPNNDVFFNSHGTFVPGEANLWHTHPGSMYLVVTQGTMTLDLGCGKVKQFAAGAAYHIPANLVHQDRNDGNTDAKFSVFQVLPHDDPTGAIASAPCP